MSLIPRKGKAWRPAGKPARLRATYTRTHGVRHMLAALDLATGRMLYRIRDRKRWAEFLGLLKVLRRAYPDQRLYVILDNFSPHKRAEVAAWCAANNVELVFIPTNAYQQIGQRIVGNVVTCLGVRLQRCHIAFRTRW